MTASSCLSSLLALSLYLSGSTGILQHRFVVVRVQIASIDTTLCFGICIE